LKIIFKTYHHTPTILLLYCIWLQKEQNLFSFAFCLLIGFGTLATPCIFKHQLVMVPAMVAAVVLAEWLAEVPATPHPP
jgi:uncharacterized membrane protein